MMKYITTYLIAMLAIFMCSILPLTAQETAENVIFESPYMAIGVTIATGLIALLVPFIRKFMGKFLEQEAVDVISESVTKVYHDWVRDVKAAAEDGKLTADEKKSALNNALANAKNVARGPVKKLLEKKGRDWGVAIIEKIIVKFKSGK